MEQLVGDRSTGQLDALKGRKCNVVIDNPTMLPKWVRDAAEILQGNVERYVFISTISVYANNAKPGQDETAPLAKYEGADAMKETRDSVIASKFAFYGPLKALSEKEAEKWFLGKTLIIRPGLIVGPCDETDRFSYWPVRIARGGEVLAPGEKSDPVQFIDGRDLAEWTIRMVEQGASGIYNATGPAKPLTIGGMREEIKTALGSDAKFPWVPAKFLESQKVAPWVGYAGLGPALGRGWRPGNDQHRAGAGERADLPAAGRDRARHPGVVSGPTGGTSGQTGRGNHARARGRGVGGVEEK